MKKNSSKEFWQKVYKKDPDSCWEWQGIKHVQGYGRFWYEGKYWLAHRLSYTLAIGVIAEGKSICHKCDNTCCVNPIHLFVGSHKENVQDMRAKGRGHFGSTHALAKLSESDVLEIRKLGSSGFSHANLARLFGVNKSGITRIINKQMWKHVA